MVKATQRFSMKNHKKHNVSYIYEKETLKNMLKPIVAWGFHFTRHCECPNGSLWVPTNVIMKRGKYFYDCFCDLLIQIGDFNNITLFSWYGWFFWVHILTHKYLNMSWPPNSLLNVGLWIVVIHARCQSTICNVHCRFAVNDQNPLGQCSLRVSLDGAPRC